MKEDKDNGRGPKMLKVMITSLDGHLNNPHPFNASDTVGDVHRFGYDRLVRQKEQNPFGQTWMEFSGQKIDDSVRLSALAEPSPGGGNEADLSFSLSWATQGG
jgi:hypothetical protein